MNELFVMYTEQMRACRIFLFFLPDYESKVMFFECLIVYISLCVYFFDTPQGLDGLSYFYVNGVNRFELLVSVTIGTSK